MVSACIGLVGFDLMLAVQAAVGFDLMRGFVLDRTHLLLRLKPACV
jgi:hypothetical protein